MSSCAALSLLDAGGNDHRLLAVVAGGLARRHRKFAASWFVVNVKDGRPPVHLCKVFRHSKCARQLPSIVFNVQINHSLNIVHHALTCKNQRMNCGQIGFDSKKKTVPNNCPIIGQIVWFFPVTCCCGAMPHTRTNGCAQACTALGS